ncbi:hypothetical protein TIFTF001_028202 [Ficus carica]|uniref:Uncharacterized protein n=1 Tax=Ficus carica TaxID=3494 RepID=A0AA88J0W5_FICCA|nr:hypothetical protein TIFTF001_028202 [Ficus carica]
MSILAKTMDHLPHTVTLGAKASMEFPSTITISRPQADSTKVSVRPHQPQPKTPCHLVPPKEAH